MFYETLKPVESCCKGVAAMEGVDAEACRNLTMFVMNAAGYQMVPIDPENDPTGDEKGMRWQKRNFDIGETLADILEYYENEVPIREKQCLIEQIRDTEYESIEAAFYDIKFGATVM